MRRPEAVRRRRARALGATLLFGIGTTLMTDAMPPPTQTQRPGPIVWAVDSLATIGGHPVTVIGSPRVVETPEGKAVEFNGTTDGLFVDHNPIAGLERFTIEVLFSPASDGAEEQRFVHIQEADSENRALVELRLLPKAVWCLDTYLRHGDAQLTLLDRTLTHPAAGWHAAALVFDGQTMTHYVDRVAQGTGTVAFKALGPGRTSIGVRQNRVSFFKGRIRLIRVTPDALAPSALLGADR